MRPIDGDELLKRIYDCGFPSVDRNGRIDRSKVAEIINKLPELTIHKKGKWIRITKNTAYTQMWNCSECGRTVEKATVLDPDIFFPFCHCGAKMEADND